MRKRRSCSSDQLFRNGTEGETKLRCEIFVGEKPETLQDQRFHSKRTAVAQADEPHTVNGFSISVVSVSSCCSHICPSQLIPFTLFFMKYFHQVFSHFAQDYKRYVATNIIGSRNLNISTLRPLLPLVPTLLSMYPIPPPYLWKTGNFTRAWLLHDVLKCCLPAFWSWGRLNQSFSISLPQGKYSVWSELLPLDQFPNIFSAITNKSNKIRIAK